MGKRACYLLTLPALLVGWLIGEAPHFESALPGDRSTTKASGRERSASALPDFLARDAAGNDPSFVEVSLRILAHAQDASGSELARLRDELDDARYETDPGYALVRRAVDEEFEIRAPRLFLEDSISHNARERVFTKWGARDLRAAFETALRTPPPGQRLGNLRAALKGGAEADPETALELVRSIPDPRLREGVAFWAVQPVLQADPSRYRKLAGEFPSAARFIYHAAFEAMTRQDLAAAIAELEFVAPAWQASARDALLRAWSRSDHGAAYRFAQEQDAPVPDELFRNWMKDDPVPALEAALDGHSFRGHDMHRLIHMISETQPAQRGQIADWLATLDDESLRARLATGLCEGDEPPSPAELEAARFAALHPADSSNEFLSLARRIQDPAERRAYFQSLPPIAGRGVLAEYAGEWLQQEPAAFAEYIESIPSERGRRSFFEQALSRNYGHREALRGVATHAGIEVP